MTRNVRRVAAGAILIAVGCNVYDPSLLVGNGGASGGTGGDSSGATGGDATGGLGGSTGGSTGGAPLVGGAGGVAGAAMNGGNGGKAGAPGGSGGSDSVAGEAGEAGMMGEGGTGGSGGSGSGAGGTAGKGGSAGTGSGGMGGSAGTAGMSGTAGTSGSAGSGGSAGSAGSSAGMAGAAGTGGSGAVTCAVLSVPLAGSSDKAHFDISFPTAINMSSGTVTMRVNVPAGVGGSIFNFIQDSSFHFLPQTTLPALASLAGMGWQTLTWHAGTQGPGSTGISMSAIKRLGIEITAVGSSSWTNPTVVYVDSITIDTPAESFDFATSGTVLSTAISGDPSDTTMWINSADSPVAGTTLAWKGSCP